MMSESKMNEIIKTSVEGIKSFTDMQTSIGAPIHTTSGVTLIPVSKVTVGFVSGGVDYNTKKFSANGDFGGGTGTGISITPLAFLVVGKNADVSLIPVSENNNSIEKIISLIEKSPDIIEKIKTALS